MHYALVTFPPSKIKAIKGTSFIASADSSGVVVRLSPDPARRRGQVSIFKDCLTSLGPAKKLAEAPRFTRQGDVVTAEVVPAAPGTTWTLPSSIWTFSPAMLRCYLALAWSMKNPMAPRDKNDIAHLFWLLRNKPDVRWGWALNGAKPPKPVPLQELTPAFAGAKVLSVGENTITAKEKLV